MNPHDSRGRTLRTLAKALAVYTAGAWVAVEIVGFLVSTYSLPRFNVDIAVVLAVAGGLAVVVITWYHAEPGTQPAPLAEKVVMGVLGLATIGVVLLILVRDPARVFHNAEGPRLLIEMPVPPPEEDDAFDMQWAPPRATVNLADEDGWSEDWFVLELEWLRLEMPGISMFIEGHPVMHQESEDREFRRVTVILPTIPATLRSLLELGQEHDTGLVEMGGFSLHIDRPFSLVRSGDSIIATVQGRFSLPGAPSDSVGMRP